MPFTRSHWHAIIRYVHACTTRTLRGRERWRGIVPSPVSPLFEKKCETSTTSFHSPPSIQREKGTNMILEKLSVPLRSKIHRTGLITKRFTKRKDLYFRCYYRGNEGKSVIYSIPIQKEVRIWKTLSSIFAESWDSFGLTWAKGTWLSLLNAPEETMTMITLLSFTCRETTRTCGLKNSKLECEVPNSTWDGFYTVRSIAPGDFPWHSYCFSKTKIIYWRFGKD